MDPVVTIFVSIGSLAVVKAVEALASAKKHQQVDGASQPEKEEQKK